MNPRTVSWLVALSGTVLTEALILYWIWKRSANSYARLQYELAKIHAELERLKLRLEEQKSRSLDDSVRIVPLLPLRSENCEPNDQVQSPSPVSSRHEVISRVTSATSDSEYVSAAEEWSPLASNSQLSRPTSYGDVSIAEEANPEILNQFQKCDELHEEDKGQECYDILKPLYDASDDNKKNTELLWRLARACYVISKFVDSKNPKKKEIIAEGQKYAVKAYEIDSESFLVLKWAAVLTGQLTDYLGTKEKIEQGYHFKEYLDKALAIKSEYSLYHMRGRFAFSVASLSWMERKLASALFATPPTATFDEALADFLEVEKMRPSQWIENLWYVARCYIEKKQNDKAVEYLKQAVSLEPEDDSEKEALENCNTLLKKYGK